MSFAIAGTTSFLGSAAGAGISGALVPMQNTTVGAVDAYVTGPVVGLQSSEAPLTGAIHRLQPIANETVVQAEISWGWAVVGGIVLFYLVRGAFRDKHAAERAADTEAYQREHGTPMERVIKALDEGEKSLYQIRSFAQRNPRVVAEVIFYYHDQCAAMSVLPEDVIVKIGRLGKAFYEEMVGRLSTFRTDLDRSVEGLRFERRRQRQTINLPILNQLIRTFGYGVEAAQEAAQRKQVKKV